MYCFSDWVKTENGFGPALPEDMGFLLLAEPKEQDTYAIFDTSVSRQEAAVLPIEPVPENLEDLLNSAKEYPPALALARDKASKLSGLTRVDFGASLASYLRDYMTGQRTSPFFLAEATRTQFGYKYAGNFYWIVGYRSGHRGGEVQWVSRDYFVYQDALADFDCDRAFLEERFPSPR